MSEIIKTLEQVKIEHIIYVMEICNYNKRDSAMLLGISEKGLFNMMKRYPEILEKRKKFKEKQEWNTLIN